MKTEKVIRVGSLALVLRSDGGIYLGHAEDNGHYIDVTRGALRIGSSAVICKALSDGLLEMEQHIRAGGAKPEGGA